MNWLISTCRNLLRKRSRKLLGVFSLSLLAGAGVVWACADYGYDDTSSFAPEYFVHGKYSPFFYDSYNRYYINADGNYVTDNISRFNNLVEKEWLGYLGTQLNKQQLSFLLFTANQKQVDSVRSRLYSKMNGQGKTFFNYLPLAKDCESFSVNENDAWYEKTPRKPVAAAIEGRIRNALAAYKDPFIRQRLWFQLVRYQFFRDTTGVMTAPAFYQYEKEFPHNLLYYRALGYMAGAEYAQKKYASANYHYSLCYNYTWEMLLPSQWSFHPQEEADWQETLKLAKSPEEKITLWHLLGLEFDEKRAIREIVKLNPKSDKLDVLLSRLINQLENSGEEEDRQAHGKALEEAVRLVDGVASRSDITKALYWHLAAGYLHYLKSDYPSAVAWYKKAKPELPVADQGLQAQYRLLTILLDVRQLKKIDPATEQKLVAPLNWLADLRDNRKTVPNLRFNDALDVVTTALGNVYEKQGNKVKANCFAEVAHFYTDSLLVDATEKLLMKKNQSPFEKAMLRYYKVSAEELFYHQALLAVYQENIRSAIVFMEKAGKLKNESLPADPFYSRLNDCHDCEFEAPSKDYTPISFLKKIQAFKTGKPTYESALALGGAYYNLTHFGNSRAFFQTDLTGLDKSQPGYYTEDYWDIFTAQDIAEKYYRQALSLARTPEQKAKAVFLLSKCERNTYYNKNTDGTDVENQRPPAGQWFAELKNNYANTAYYREVLKECGYFRSYVNGQKK